MVQGVNSKVMAEVLFAAEGTSKRDVKKAVDDELQKAISEGRVSKSEARAIKAEIRTNGYDAAIARQNTVEENVEAYKNGDKMSIGTNAALILDSKNLDIDNVVGLARTHGGEDFKLSQRQQKAFMEELNNQIENTLYQSDGRIYDVQSYPDTDVERIESLPQPTITDYPSY